MAESGSSGWFGGWLQTAKDKSTSALEFMKKDLTEFASTMQHDTTKAAENFQSKITQENAATATKKVKDGVSNFLGGISKALVIPPDDEEGTPIKMGPDGETTFDRKKARLNAVQLDPGTYLNEPEKADEYKEWSQDFVLDERKGDISELLVVNVEVRSLYTQMVPSSVSHADFWQRYYFKVHQLQQDEDRRAALMKRADVSADTQQQDLSWDDDEDFSEPSDSPIKSQDIPADVTNVTQDQTDSAPVTTSASTEPQAAAPPTTESEEEATAVNTCDTNDRTKSDSEAAVDVSQPVKITVSEEAVEDIKTREKGDIVVVGSDSTSPSSSSPNSTNKEVTSLDDDWEKDFDDVEVTEEDMRRAEEVANKMLTAKTNTGDDDDDDADDWESWE